MQPQTITNNLSEKLHKLTKEDIPSTAKLKYNTKPKAMFNFTFNKTSEQEIYELILQLDSTKGPGIDTLYTKSLKSILNIISSHLTLLFNDSMITGIYPQCLQLAKCIPIYKGTPLDPPDPINYRPISILTGINKVFEHILHNHISQYIEKIISFQNFNMAIENNIIQVKPA